RSQGPHRAESPEASADSADEQTPVVRPAPACHAWTDGNHPDLTLHPAIRLLIWQGGLCAICGTAIAPGRRALDHDHDPASWLVRGWLCTRCNTLEGTSSSPVLDAYREWHPAMDLGIRWTYDSGKLYRIRDEIVAALVKPPSPRPAVAPLDAKVISPAQGRRRPRRKTARPAAAPDPVPLAPGPRQRSASNEEWLVGPVQPAKRGGQCGIGPRVKRPEPYEQTELHCGKCDGLTPVSGSELTWGPAQCQWCSAQTSVEGHAFEGVDVAYQPARLLVARHPQAQRLRIAVTLRQESGGALPAQAREAGWRLVGGVRLPTAVTAYRAWRGMTLRLDWDLGLVDPRHLRDAADSGSVDLPDGFMPLDELWALVRIDAHLAQHAEQQARRRQMEQRWPTPSSAAGPARLAR
ncbi:endonuclease domain-containing protein, partial [Streptomyces rubradiris]|uniref:endonuclease domain-containing protein n=1 Tax=Streptomyces rubradiris TaxID=285531 RepID=UPI0036ED2C8E